MVDSLATEALETLRDLLVKEAKFLSGVGDQVNQVERDLKTMHSLLMDADKRSDRYDRASLLDWIANLKDLAREAQNVLEKYAVEVRSGKEGKDLKEKLKRFASIWSECFSGQQVGKEVEHIRSQLTDLTEKLKSMSRGEKTADDEQQHQLRLRYAHEVDQHFVGMEKDIEFLVSRVKDDQRCSPAVISIYGMGGLGKTTVARKIYHRRDVQGCFEARAWFCVTQKFQADTVLRGIFKQIDKKEEINSMEHHELVVELHNVLKQRKCLIVIDDIWEPQHWRILKHAFPTNCKVLLTTRKQNIVSDKESVNHKLNLLTEDQGWELLQKTAILKNDAPGVETRSRSLENIGRQMVKKCGRLPLAISVIGGILRQKEQTFVEWKKVSDNINSYLERGGGVGNDTGVKKVLELSYDSLPYYLKPCFLYLGCFPEDEQIQTEDLYLLWMAEGLISSEEKGSNETLRDVAERYLTELAFRCVVQVEKNEFNTNYKFQSCQLHDLMRDLCSSKAEEEKFLKCISFPKDNTSPSTDNSIRRLAICADGAATTLRINGIQKLESLRSFLVHKSRRGGGRIHFQNSIIDSDMARYLRILKLSECEFEDGRLPSKVGKLTHLRYLDLSSSNVKELPASICNLPYLQTLVLNVSHPIKLPNVIWKMKRLRHLYLWKFDVIGGDKLILDGLEELETLEHIESDKVRITDIPKLTKLRDLSVGVKDMDSASVIAQHMRNNGSQLRMTLLDVESCDFSSEEGTNVFEDILMSHSPMSLVVRNCDISCGFPCYQDGICENLIKLTLLESKIGGDVVETLGKYPRLQFLILLGKETVKTKMICGANLFPELKSLRLYKLPDLKKWEVEERAMPKLTTLDIAVCSNLEKIPDGLRFISTLRELKTMMPKEFNDRLRVINGQPGEDYYKISHIPTIDLYDSDEE